MKNGPKHPHNRSCTDVLCCILFMINAGVLVGFALYGYTNGDTTNVYRATDEFGNVCGGSNSATKDYSYSYFYNPMNLDKRKCVKVCPEFSGSTLTTIDCYDPNNNGSKCNYEITINQNGEASGSYSDSAVVGYESHSVIGRICVPTSTVFNNAF